MKAMLLNECGPVERRPLVMSDIPAPEPGAGEILLKIMVCGICHTDLHVVAVLVID